MNLKSALSVLLIGSSVFCVGQAIAAPSSALTKICADAFGVVEQKGAPTGYVESLTLQDMEARVEFGDGTNYQIWPNNATPQGRQTENLRYLARIAYFTGTPVNLCVGMGVIWAIELDGNKRPRAPWLLSPGQNNQ